MVARPVLVVDLPPPPGRSRSARRRPSRGNRRRPWRWRPLRAALIGGSDRLERHAGPDAPELLHTGPGGVIFCHRAPAGGAATDGRGAAALAASLGERTAPALVWRTPTACPRPSSRWRCGRRPTLLAVGPSPGPAAGRWGVLLSTSWCRLPYSPARRDASRSRAVFRTENAGRSRRRREHPEGVEPQAGERAPSPLLGPPSKARIENL